MADQRIGMGFDVHAFGGDGPLVIGGVRFAETGGLLGHSDADVVAHAVADSLLGAAGLGDIGMHFPDTDPRWIGADSVELLGHVVDLVADAGWSVVNVDCSVVLEQPKLAPRRDEMETVLTDSVRAPVTIKGKRAESLGAVGRGEGIACWAVALLRRDGDG
jgi:2-C-methyl-D-erythritol 2,4-cyclodiphosphate synthase